MAWKFLFGKIRECRWELGDDNGGRLLFLDGGRVNVSFSRFLQDDRGNLVEVAVVGTK